MSFFRSVLAVALALAAGCCCEEESPWKSRGARVLGLDSARAEDPVSGRSILKTDAVKREYKGAIYHFESAENAALFDRDPSLYGVVENVPPRDPDEVK